MTGIEIGLIIIGIACICASFFVSRKMASQELQNAYGSSHPTAEIWTEQDEQMVKERLQEILEEQQEEYVEEAKDRMGHICNEKIMAVDEFSKQILEKINSNHQEVVFMYNMLNEKQKELKVVMAEPVRPEEAKPEKPKERVRQVAAQASVPSPAIPDEIALFQTASTQAGVLTGLAQVKKSAPKSKMAQKQQQKKTGSVQTGTEKEDEQHLAVSGNANQEIQKMYREGKSVLEISKALDIGQGEVKLVIALYEGKKK